MIENLETVACVVNGRKIKRAVDPRLSLIDFLRHDLGLTGSHVGCEHGVCGACTIVLDGRIVRGCLLFAVQCTGMTVETIEGASESGRLAKLQEFFESLNALQCGFCTSGMLLTAAELLDEDASPSRATIREKMSGNICRCTGYHAIIDAIEACANASAVDRASNDAPNDPGGVNGESGSVAPKYLWNIGKAHRNKASCK
jgi:aerobic-type carbon monoxide dehydrogenase small subunit (CoxS/CutS family)